jgi:lipid-A-disaccharide synthase
VQPITEEKKKIFITCGEVSGDLNGANLVRTIRELAPNFDFAGIGGAHLRSAGVKILFDSTQWGSIGMIEAVAKIPKVYPALRSLPALFREEKPDLFVPVDYRFFNMKAARVAKRLGIPVVYFFAPVSWFGSGEKRFRMLADTVDLSLVALPVSLDSYRAAGANYEFIGHPLIDTAKPSMNIDQARKFFGVEPENIVIGLMPGSRVQEIKRLMPVFTEAVRLITEKIPGTQFLLFRAAETFEPLIKKLAGDAPITIVREKIYDFMELSDLLILCSGTAAHEATIMEKPMIVTYKLSAFTAWLARKTMAPPFVALPNIIAGRFVVPELLQEECTAVNIAQKAVELLSDHEEHCRIISGLSDVKAQLGEPGALERAARRVVDSAIGNIPRLSGGLNADGDSAQPGRDSV